MIEPVQLGAALTADIEESMCDRPKLWWLGQSGFAIKYRSAILYIDPYLSESLTGKYASTPRPHIRMTRCPLDPERITHADLILSTHKHSDHLDPGTVPAMLASSPRAKLVLPKAHVAHAEAMGIARDRMLPADAGAAFTLLDIQIAAVPAAHEQLDYSPETGYPHLGYVIRCGDRTIYHPGDCVPYDGQVEVLRPFEVTVALLPINGRDPARGVAGNFSIEEATALAAAIGAEWLAPMHYDMFTFNTVDVALFIRHLRAAHPRQQFKVFQCGEGWSVPAKAARPGVI